MSRKKLWISPTYYLVVTGTSLWLWRIGVLTVRPVVPRALVKGVDRVEPNTETSNSSSTSSIETRNTQRSSGGGQVLSDSQWLQRVNRRIKSWLPRFPAAFRLPMTSEYEEQALDRLPTKREYKQKVKDERKDVCGARLNPTLRSQVYTLPVPLTNSSPARAWAESHSKNVYGSVCTTEGLRKRDPLT